MKTENVLKDVEMQLALEKLFPGFGKALSHEGFHCAPVSKALYARLILWSRRGGAQWILSIPEEEITRRQAYEPGVWLDPDVIPPEGETMCVEIVDNFEHTYKRLGSFKDGQWHVADFPQRDGARLKRYRSWER